jgi:hypothetical protein
MTDKTMASIMFAAGCATLVLCFGIMADCSKRVAEVEADPRLACVEGGGVWWDIDGYEEQMGECIQPRADK